jgi:predicted membrane protein
MGGLVGAFRQIVGSFNILWPLAILGFLHSNKQSRIMALLIPLAILQIAFATDVVRMTVVGFPAVLLLVANLFRVLTRQERIAATVLAVGTFYAYDWNFYRQIIAGVGSLLIFLWYFIMVRRRIRERNSIVNPSLDLHHRETQNT